MRIGVYALAKNEAKHAAAWAESCADADVRVVTDTGSTDDTVQLLDGSGVHVARGYVCPWRWDEAHNLSLHHLPPSVDIAIRLDLDERIRPGWREAVERAWTDNVNCLRYRYIWSWKSDGSPGVVFYGDRIHARAGFRWLGATHEGLVSWSCDKVQAMADVEIHHHRDTGKRHKTDLELLRVAVREAPADSRPRWYLAREMDYAGMPEAAAEFSTYLRMPYGQPTERAYAMRTLWRLTQDERHLHAAASECPQEPDAWERLAFVRYSQQQWRECVQFAEKAILATDAGTHATDPDARGRAYDLASVALWQLGRRPDAVTAAREAMALFPGDERIRANLAEMTHGLTQDDSAGAG